MRDVVWFNYPTYLAALGVVVAGAAAVLVRLLPAPFDMVLLVGVVIAAWWLIASILAAAWVFTFSGATQWTWVPGALGGRPTVWTNITSGFDDTTARLRAALAHTHGNAIDAFDGQGQHDGTLQRARRRFPPPGLPVTPGQPLQIAERSQDAVFLLMAAHELDPTTARPWLFAEVARILSAGGRLLIVEFPFGSLNGYVFGPGALHFESPETWAGAAGHAGLRAVSERRVALFARAFVFEKPAAESPPRPD